MQISLQKTSLITLDTPTPFTLVTHNNNHSNTLQCEQILRLLPGRRLVLLARHNEQRCIVKLFFSRTHFDRERNGLHVLNKAGFAAPEVLFSIEDDVSNTYLLALNYIYHAADLRSAWQTQSDDDGRSRLLVAGLALLRSMHEAGIYQNDIHWRNFLVGDENRLFVIDAGDINTGSAPIEPQTALNNLGLFIAQIAPEYEELVFNTIDSYSTDISKANLIEAIQERRQYRLNRYAKKSLRNSTEFTAHRDWHHYSVQRRDFTDLEFTAQLGQLDVWIDQGHALKRGNSSTVSDLSIHGNHLVIKRYNVKNLLHALRRFWRPSRAIRSWQSAHYLKLINVPTPQPIAALEKRWGPVRRQAYLVTEHVEGVSLRDFVQQLNTDNAPIPRWLEQQLVTLLKNLWRSRLSHGDFKATNFLVANETLILIDLDAMQLHSGDRDFKRAIKKDGDRFLANWQNEQLAHFRSLIEPVLREFNVQP